MQMRFVSHSMPSSQIGSCGTKYASRPDEPQVFETGQWKIRGHNLDKSRCTSMQCSSFCLDFGCNGERNRVPTHLAKSPKRSIKIEVTKSNRLISKLLKQLSTFTTFLTGFFLVAILLAMAIPLIGGKYFGLNACGAISY